MNRVLLINPNQWGRGITHLWLCSHSALLKKHGHTVAYFDSTFFEDWSANETSFNTENKQYQPTDYESIITVKTGIRKALQKEIKSFNPTLIMISAISSHIHGEGEYINIELGNELLNGIEHSAIVCAGGIQATASPEYCMRKYHNIEVFIQGDSEFTLLEIASLSKLDPKSISSIKGTALRDHKISERRERVQLSEVPQYDYSIFEDQVFLRPYNGKVIRAADYEFSRGCIFTCAYCVETTIQSYLGFTKHNKIGVLQDFRKYITVKSILNTIKEIKEFRSLNIQLLRCQDTNFLSIPREYLNEIADYLSREDIYVPLYIETRPETISPSSIELLKKLNVIGVGMGVETAAEDYREDNLNRFSSLQKIERAFKLLKDANIKRSSYNILGMPGQSERDILATIDLNHRLKPDNITVSFYSPFMGTKTALNGMETNEYNNESNLSDSQLRSNTHSKLLTKQKLEYYKKNFNDLCRSGKSKPPVNNQSKL
tara:strand:+ start:3569 stop:5032 length:1464 start_codon:yes stop_codon:yes gene_type:complete